MHDRCLEKTEEDTYVVANVGGKVPVLSGERGLSNLAGQMYDEKGQRFDAEGTRLTLDYGQPFPD